MRSALVLALVSAASGSIVFIQDAAIDDFVCTLLLTRASETSAAFRGEIIVNADSVLPDSMQAVSKMHAALGVQGQVPLSLSGARMYNGFPWAYRAETQLFNNLSSLAPFHSAVSWPYVDGDRWLLEFLENSTNGSVDVALTTAATPVVNVLQKHPHLAAKIKRVLWMAGAVHVPGNLDPSEFNWRNSKAEWNVFADPFAAKDLLLQSQAHGFPVLLFPLDISDTTPIRGAYMQALREALNQTTPGTPEHQLRQVVLDAYNLVQGDAFYRLWDATTVGYLQWPELYAAPKPLPLTVETDPAKEQGWTRVCAPSEGCPKVQVFTSFASEEARKQFIHNVAVV
eukprot:TRINITY_DN890_c0_g1_i2.p1 TRINITY_DN890_c0_g1~~TRINITY_DN890_c0_g1_i2.p1  ORF type:complete len:341 (+),score=88.44 TRINITY_DN890_c0_g1_i2:91-1113(+)